jgi:hypothetical protein
MRSDRSGEVELMCYDVAAGFDRAESLRAPLLHLVGASLEKTQIWYGLFSLRYAEKEFGTCQVLSQDRDYAAFAVVWNPMLKIFDWIMLPRCTLL